MFETSSEINKQSFNWDQLVGEPVGQNSFEGGMREEEGQVNFFGSRRILPNCPPSTRGNPDK